MNIFNLKDKEFDIILNNLFTSYSKEELLKELIECDLVLNEEE